MREPFAEFVEAELSPNILLITCGLPGTWKTETSQEISKIKGYPILRTDLIRLEVLKNEDIFDAKVAGNMSKRELVYDEMFRQAENLAHKGKGVILDATFVKPVEPKEILRFGEKYRPMVRWLFRADILNDREVEKIFEQVKDVDNFIEAMTYDCMPPHIRDRVRRE